jgi:hypothetical protein
MQTLCQKWRVNVGEVRLLGGGGVRQDHVGHTGIATKSGVR